MLDADTFRGINARLPELGGVVLDATQKIMKNSLGATAAELAKMYNAPATLNSNTRAGGPEEGLREGSSMAPRASIDFFSGLSLADRQQQQQATARGGTGNSTCDSALPNGGCLGVGWGWACLCVCASGLYRRLQQAAACVLAHPRPIQAAPRS